MTYDAAAHGEDDPLSTARGMFIGSILGLLLWTMIFTLTGQLG